ncbi:hypothetical protein DL768_001812 [Monosporascus sp. mg162]|nr:hypothetical protein DL768_001812 [Monosporascus sp. mg162]
MKNAALLTFAATAAHASVMHITAMPRQAPTEIEGPTSTQTPDPWVCATKNMTEFFDMPKPTGTLLDAIDAYVIKQLAPCWATATGPDQLSCEVTGSQWCGFSTDAPPSATAAYSSYGSAAASWWSAKSSAISSVASECPITWERYDPIEQSWLDITIAQAECYAEAHPGGGSSSSAPSATGPTAVPGTGATATEATPTVPNGALGRADGVDMWMLAGTGIAIAVVSSAM